MAKRKRKCRECGRGSNGNLCYICRRKSTSLSDEVCHHESCEKLLTMFQFQRLQTGEGKGYCSPGCAKTATRMALYEPTEKEIADATAKIREKWDATRFNSSGGYVPPVEIQQLPDWRDA